MSSRRIELSTRAFLLLLVAGLLIPGVAFTSFVLYRFAESQQQSYRAGVLHASERIAAAVDRELGGLETALRALSTGRSFGERAYDRFYERALEVRRITGADVLLKDSEGQHLVNTRVGFGTVLPKSLQDHEKRALETGRTQSSDLFIGVFSREPTISITLPLFRDGRPSFLLTIAIGPQRLREVLTSQALPQNWSASIFDSVGRLIARSSDGVQIAPSGAAPESAVEADGSVTTWEGVTLDGTRALFAFARPQLAPHWRVTVGIPLDIASTPLLRAVFPLIAAGCIALLVCIAVAVWLGGRAARFMERLARNAAALGTSKPVEHLKTPVWEINRVGGALVDASQALAQRDRERFAAEEALLRLNESLEAAIEERSAQLVQLQKLEALGQLTGGVAHDFNNLLMAVLGSLELLKKRHSGDPRAARLIDNAIQGARRGATLTQRLLAFARRQELALTAVDVPRLVHGMSDLLRRSLGPRIELDIAFPADLPAATADAHQLELAVLNLAVNSRDAMLPGGRLVMRARHEQADGSVVLSIVDTGTGMDAETLRRASEPFFTTKGVGKGTGLGLSMVHGLAEQSGGKLVLQSQPGQGTTAELWLPVAGRPADAEARSHATEIDRSVTGLRILIVDDDPLVLDSTAHLLEDMGQLVVAVASGALALNALQADRAIDLVITDFAMPGMTGTELIREIRQRHPALPIILATGYAETPDDPESGIPRLAKPFNQASLASALAQAIATEDVAA